MKKLKREIPGYCGQMKILSTRTAIQWWRNNPSRLIFFAAMAVGALVLAMQDAIVKSPPWDAMCYVNTHTCVGLLVSIYCLQVFGENQPVFWRERNRGLNVAAYENAKTSLNNADIIMQTFLFAAIYYAIRGLQLGFFVFWIPYLLVAFAASGWGYAISAWIPYTHGPFVASLIMFVVCGLLGNPFNLAKFLKSPLTESVVSVMSITRWSIPMSFWLYVDTNHPTPEEGKEEAIYKQYTASMSEGMWAEHLGGYWYAGLEALLVYGVLLRIVAYLGLKFKNRDKQV